MPLFRLVGYNHAQKTFQDSDGAFSAIPENAVILSTSLPDGYAEDDSPDAWVAYRSYIEGKFPTAMDYLAIRTHIMDRIEAIAGTDYSNYSNLSPQQAQIALVWCNIRIANELSLQTYYALCGSARLGTSYIADQLQAAFEARHKRYVKFKTVLYSTLGKTQGLFVESLLRANALVDQYIQNGVVQNAIDGVPGIGDLIQGRSPYETSGLLPRLVSGTIVAGTNPPAIAAYLENILLTGDL